MNSNKCICKVPFSEIEIHNNGDVYVCCPIKNRTVIGNIYKEDNFDNIWYSEIAQNLRKEILEQNYCKCDLNICNPLNNIEQDKLNLMKDNNINLSTKPPYPKYVKFCHEIHCNLKCITCRDKFVTSDSKQTKLLNSYIHTKFLPILKNCEIVSMNGSGEVFASAHCKTLIKEIVKEYPNIKFDLHTNGLLCTKEMCDNLGITNRICSIDISMHAIKKKTYNKIMIGSNYNKVISNLKWLSSLLKEGSLQRLDLYFVVQKMNYKEMIPFIKFANTLNANVYFWEYRDWGPKLGKKYDKIAVFNKNHIEYNKLAKILQNPIFKNENVYLNNLLSNIKPIPKTQIIKNVFFTLKNDITNNINDIKKTIRKLKLLIICSK